MTSVSKSSAYPKSVQPGIPTLPPCPPGWKPEPLGKHLIEQMRPIQMADDQEYDLVTVKRSRGGVVPRERLLGRDISVKSQYRLNAGDFLVSKRQIVHGACGIVPKYLDGSIVSGEYAVLVAQPTIDLKFLSYLAHSIYFQQTCFHSSIGVHVEKMIFKLDQWFKWNFNLPPLSEQQRIAEILSTWDSAIQTVEALIANARDQKKALMQQLLSGKRRLHGFKSKWQQLTFDDAVYVDRANLGQNTNPGFRFRYISLSDVEAGHISDELADMSFSDSPSRARRKVAPGDILMATVRPNLQAFALVAAEHADCIASTGFSVLSAKAGFDPHYVFHYLFSDHVIGQIEALVVGSNYPAINSSDIKGLAICCPDESEQQAIAKVLDDAERLISLAVEKLSALKREKAALMQQLLSGKRRVNLKAMEAA